MREDMGVYVAMSPATYAHEMEAPVDLRCNIEQGRSCCSTCCV